MSDKEKQGIMKKTTLMETNELIELVRQRSCIWDRNDLEYRNREQKNKAWSEICRALDPTYDDMSRIERHEFGMVITRKWCNIRDCYKKYLNGSSRFSATGRPYLHAEQLTFLNAVYESMEQEKNRKRKHYTEEPEETQQEEWLNEVFIEMENTEDTLAPGSTKKIKSEYPRVKENVEADDNIVSVLVNLIEKEEDEDRAFFKSITPAVKSLSDNDKFVFRIQVLKLLNALKKKRHPSVKRPSLCQESESE